MFCGSQAKCLCKGNILTSLRAKLIEDMKISLSFFLTYNARFLQKIRINLGTNQSKPFIEKDVDVLAKSRGVVISQCLSISECFKYWIALQDLLFSVCS
mmetsp:Transcript_21205/g.47809  ORF Transcript_21205/g.47809 Transcript_21205/m.47809 type:complete len:99 (+) Transcript_21205:1198-1494(+)